MRTFGPFPIAGADQDFTVALALLAMKFVNRHKTKIAGATEISSESSLNCATGAHLQIVFKWWGIALR